MRVLFRIFGIKRELPTSQVLKKSLYSSLSPCNPQSQKVAESTAGLQNVQEDAHSEHRTSAVKYRFVYPEFLPDPNPEFRNSLREKLERMDMLSRRNFINIPEFYVGSVLSVMYSEPHAPGKANTFTGICIQRKGSGLRASFILRNVVNNQGVEVLFEMYDPAIQKIDCLRLEKRLDNELLYLRDAPLEYSTFPFDMDPIILPEGAPVPVNEIKVPLKPPPWLERWERKNLKGVQELVVNERRRRKAAAAATPWEKYDLMKVYRETIPEEEQREIFTEIQSELEKLDMATRAMRRKRGFVLPKKTG